MPDVPWAIFGGLGAGLVLGWFIALTTRAGSLRRAAGGVLAGVVLLAGITLALLGGGMPLGRVLLLIGVALAGAGIGYIGHRLWLEEARRLVARRRSPQGDS